MIKILNDFKPYSLPLIPAPNKRPILLLRHSFYGLTELAVVFVSDFLIANTFNIKLLVYTFQNIERFRPLF